MEPIDLGILKLEIFGCKVGNVKFEPGPGVLSSESITITLVGGTGAKYLAEVAMIPFENDHIDLEVSIDHERYDNTSYETFVEWATHENYLRLAIRENITLIWDEEGRALMLPPFDVDVNLEDVWAGSPSMN